MGISWTDAVRDADDADAWAQVRRALQQACDLEPLIYSFAKAINDSGKWPRTGHYDEWNGNQWKDTGPAVVDTRGDVAGYGAVRRVCVRPDGSWFIAIPYQEAKDKGMEDDRIAFGAPGSSPRLSRGDDNLFVTSRGFAAHVAEMEQSKDWVPRELVAYLRANGIPIPKA
ncbi:hypothetical protein ACEXQD_06565 [Herbiconiux sp. P15]|uniref:hypothetical protein n=1 Tax=Herbiconiux liukaitaii TaxID=3342799 RepID=UPI0035B72DF3